MDEKVLFKISNGLVFNEGFLFLVHMFPTSIYLTKKKLIYKYLGSIIKQISAKDITDIEIVKKKWIHYRLANTIFPKALMLTYKEKGKIKHTYITISDKDTDDLFKLLKRKK